MALNSSEKPASAKWQRKSAWRWHGSIISQQTENIMKKAAKVIEETMKARLKLRNDQHAIYRQRKAIAQRMACNGLYQYHQQCIGNQPNLYQRISAASDNARPGVSARGRCAGGRAARDGNVVNEISMKMARKIGERRK